MDDEDDIDRQIRELQERKARLQQEAADAKRDLENAKKKKEAERAKKLATLAALQKDISGLASSVVASETGIRRIIDVDESSSSDSDDMSMLTKEGDGRLLADEEGKKSATVSSVTSARLEKDGKKSIKDADGRIYRVYNKLVAAEAVRYNLHATRLTDPRRINVLFGEEQIQMAPSVWLDVLKKKCTDEIFAFTFGDRTGWATAALYYAVIRLPVMTLEGLSAFLDGSCASLQWFRPQGLKRPDTLEDIAEAFRSIEWVYVVVHSGAFSGICNVVTSQLYSHALQFANRDYLVHYLERCLREFNRITSAPVYEVPDESWPADLRSVDNCVAIWHILFSDIAESMTLQHQTVYLHGVQSKEYTRFTMQTDVLAAGNPFLTPAKIAKRTRPAGADSDDEASSKSKVKRLQDQLRKTTSALKNKERENVVSPGASPPSKSYCGQHLLALADLGDACHLGARCGFTHVASLESASVTKVRQACSGNFGRKVDHALLDDLFIKVKLLAAKRVSETNASRDDADTTAGAPASDNPGGRRTPFPPGRGAGRGAGRGSGRGGGARGSGSAWRSPKAGGRVSQH